MTIEQNCAFQTAGIVRLQGIEIGFPAASQIEYDFTRLLIEGGHIPDDVTIQVLVQAREHLIDRTFEALQGVKRAIVHVYNSTSKVQRDKVYQKDEAEITAIAVAGATMLQERAARYPGSEWIFEYSPESFSQTEPDFRRRRLRSRLQRLAAVGRAQSHPQPAAHGGGLHAEPLRRPNRILLPQTLLSQRRHHQRPHPQRRAAPRRLRTGSHGRR